MVSDNQSVGVMRGELMDLAEKGHSSKNILEKCP